MSPRSTEELNVRTGHTTASRNRSTKTPALASHSVVRIQRLLFKAVGSAAVTDGGENETTTATIEGVHSHCDDQGLLLRYVICQLLQYAISLSISSSSITTAVIAHIKIITTTTVIAIIPGLALAIMTADIITSPKTGHQTQIPPGT